MSKTTKCEHNWTPLMKVFRHQQHKDYLWYDIEVVIKVYCTKCLEKKKIHDDSQAMFRNLAREYYEKTC